jgi:beta-galactosidase
MKENAVGRFSFSGENFEYNGSPVVILSGAVHYFRTVPQYWKDRLLKLKACGLNTVETYIPWNLHEPRPGIFNFQGLANVEEFIKTAGEMELWVILRPSPYICAEWELGGLPSWLLADSDIRLRCFNKPFLDRIDAYYDVLLPKLVPLQCTKGGPVIAFQIENEYGSYGNDIKYLEYLKTALHGRGIDTLLFTSDGIDDRTLEGGTPEGVLKTVNFGSKPEEAFKNLRKHQADGPLMCTEFWIGWFDHWGKERSKRAAGDVADELDKLFAAGASVNFYMFHGGTNFGFYNGANYVDKYEPLITSYDYDALLNEAGDPTEKYYAVRDSIMKHFKTDIIDMPKPSVKKDYGVVSLTHQASLFDVLACVSEPIKSQYPLPMESIGQDYGFILYECSIKGTGKEELLKIYDVHDRALIYIDDKYIGIIDRNSIDKGLQIEIPSETANLKILVENMGRINYGPLLYDMKGITERVVINYQAQFDWMIYPLPLDNISHLDYGPLTNLEGPAFYKGAFAVDEPADTFMNMEGWTKGVVYINGFNLGRYWHIGPQKALYVPAPLLHPGTNEVVVFELHSKETPVIRFSNRQIW